MCVRTHVSTHLDFIELFYAVGGLVIPQCLPVEARDPEKSKKMEVSNRMEH